MTLRKYVSHAQEIVAGYNRTATGNKLEIPIPESSIVKEGIKSIVGI